MIKAFIFVVVMCGFPDGEDYCMYMTNKDFGGSFITEEQCAPLALHMLEFTQDFNRENRTKVEVVDLDCVEVEIKTESY